MAALAWQQEEERERSRRRLLAEADRILDGVEERRLIEQRAVPPDLAEAIQALQRRLGRRAATPTTLAAAHRLVLALQGRLMISNPRVAATRAHEDRPRGQPLMKVVQGGVRWKLLTLPAAPAGGPDAAWAELVEATVERAHARWAYALEQARRAARSKREPIAALARERLAWTNYRELCQEAEILIRRTRARS
jgi:hypothetical protein